MNMPKLLKCFLAILSGILIYLNFMIWSTVGSEPSIGFAWLLLIAGSPISWPLIWIIGNLNFRLDGEIAQHIGAIFQLIISVAAVAQWPFYHSIFQLIRARIARARRPP